MEENGNCAVTSESVEDLSEYTDADESMSAPTEILAEFLSAVMLKDYENALKYCKMILQYEPNHATAKEFYPLILEKIIQGATNLVGDKFKRSSPSSSSLSSRGDSDDSESDNEEVTDSDAEEEEEEEEEDVSAGSSSRGTTSSSGSPAEERLSSPESDGTTASYSSIEDEVADNNLASSLKPGVASGGSPLKPDDNSFKTNGNKETSDSESPTEPVSQMLTDRLMATVFPNVL
ncbi:uncharacterized protein isoform X2 [Rhodnius prolixus]|uniref:Glutamate-rich protein 2 n=1 Tax=Rhodnius prolixus TaxID=13249 RepID=T1HX74_RHOPR